MTEQQWEHDMRLLVSEAMDGTLNRDGIKRLEELLESGPEVRRRYREYVSLHCHLRTALGGEQLTSNNEIDSDTAGFLGALAKYEQAAPELEVPKVEEQESDDDVREPLIVRPSEYTSGRLTRMAIAASLAAGFILAIYVILFPATSSSMVGTLAECVDATLTDQSGMTVQAGSELYSGEMVLTKGFAEIQMACGDLVIIEGPARFDLESDTGLELIRGKLVVKVENSADHSFVVRTAQACIVDYGTEFGVEVDKSNQTRTHVYQGRVEMRSGDNPLRFESSMSLGANEAARADAKGSLSRDEGLSGAFVRADEFDVKLKASRGSEYHRWLAYSLRLRQDPSLVVYYPFEKDETRSDVLVNEAEGTTGELDGVLVSANNSGLARWGEGRWSEKTALFFNRAQQQYIQVGKDPRLSINGPITVAVWIYRDKDTDGGHILSSRDVSRGFCNYQIGYRSPGGTDWSHGVHLARKASSEFEEYKNQQFTRSVKDIAGWVLVAATHDNKTVKFYLNGECIDTKPWNHKQVYRETGLVIGTDLSPDEPARFNGAMGEVAIFNRALSEGEIQAMYEAGKK